METEGARPEQVAMLSRLALAGETIVIRRDVLIACGHDYPLAIMVGRLLFFSAENWRDPERAGWCYMSARDWMTHCALTEDQVKKANRRLVALGIPIETAVRARLTGATTASGQPHRAPVKHYRVRPREFAQWLSAAMATHLGTSEPVPMPPGVDAHELAAAELAAVAAPAPAGDPLRERRGELVGAFCEAKGLDAAARRSDSGRIAREIRELYPDEAAFEDVPLELFRAVTVWLLERNEPRWVWPRMVVSHVAEYRAKAAPLDPEFAVAYRERMRRGGVPVTVADEELAPHILRMLQVNPRTTVREMLEATRWWWRERNRPPLPEVLPFVVRDWRAAGRPVRQARVADAAPAPAPVAGVAGPVGEVSHAR